jgi:hypothetical protein
MTLSGKSILESLESCPLSASLRKALRLAQTFCDKDLERWCRLELGGYLSTNPAMANDIVVPEYRTVVGRYNDIYGRVLLIPADLAVVSEYRLPNAVETIEALVSSRDTVTIHDPRMCELIQQHLKVQVYAFSFSSMHLRGVLSSIRLELQDRLSKYSSRETADESQFEGRAAEVVEIRPNIYGVGVNLRALWKKFKGRPKGSR